MVNRPNVSGNLPDGMKPGDSDPVGPKPMRGFLYVNLAMRVKFNVHPGEACESVDAAVRQMLREMREVSANEVDLEFSRIEVHTVRFKPQ